MSNHSSIFMEFLLQSYEGFGDLEHLGGDMVESVPHGDVIFLKVSTQLLPKQGKVMIVVDGLLPPTVEMTSRARINYNIDLLMYTFFQGGTERNLQALQEVAAAAGFAAPQVIMYVNELTVIEMPKL
ncbi:hypothetical protein L7F22_041218 [Adiantum nelumboides]|nr:hypothetical protein [Adiantum nelumboides]